ncbi:MAG: methylmalonyl-CoA mutase family protein [Hyphomonadaceae bacterium]
MTKPAPLAADFSPPDEAAWRKLAEKSLKGAPWERLVGKTADGAALKPLYREADFATANDPSGFPGGAPFVRGAAAARPTTLPWHIRQIVAHPDPEKANAEILADLERGVSSIALSIDPDGHGGVAIRTAAQLAITLEGVLADLAPIAIDAGLHSQWAGEILAAYLAERNLRDAPAAFNVDPIGALMRTGTMSNDALAKAAAFAKKIAHNHPNASALRVDAQPVHEAGGSEGQELGAALAAGIAYLRALTEAGVSIHEASRLILFSFSVGPDVLVETAKLRALRLTWARVMEAAGAKPENRAAQIHAVTSLRMMTRHDPWTNILRGTAASAAAAFGGAEAITTRPLTDPIGLPTAFARRIARNTQIVLMEESRLGHVTDPAGGAWFVEKMTRDLAEAGWAFMQKIEIEGGVIAALTRGWLQDDIKAIREAHQRAFATRKETITGVTDFPLLGAEAPAIETSSYKPKGQAPAAPAKDIACAPLAPIRWAEPFEALRVKAERAQAPKVFFATLGALSEFSARANFARNLFAVGGIGAHEPEAIYEGPAQMCAAYAAAQTPTAVIVGTDAAYETQAAEAARALKAAGAEWIILAGRPGAQEEALRAAGVDQFVFVGRDALEMLERLHASLGIAA